MIESLICRFRYYRLSLGYWLDEHVRGHRWGEWHRLGDTSYETRVCRRYWCLGCDMRVAR